MFSQKNSYFLRFIFLFFTLIFFSSCSDFSAIFNSGQSRRSSSKGSSKGKKIASKKTRKSGGRVVKGFFLWPLEGEVSSGFGQRGGRPHDGIDIRAEKGSPVLSSAAGEIAYSGTLHGYGNLILVKHADNYFTAYAHNNENLVKEGKRVEQGEEIAKVGDTGNASGYHLHFEIRDGSTPMDPLLFLPSSPEAIIVESAAESQSPLSPDF